MTDRENHTSDKLLNIDQDLGEPPRSSSYSRKKQVIISWNVTHPDNTSYKKSLTARGYGWPGWSVCKHPVSSEHWLTMTVDVTIKYVNHSTYLAIGLYQGPTTARVDFVAAIWTEFDPENKKNTINIGLNEVCIWYCDLKKKTYFIFQTQNGKGSISWQLIVWKSKICGLEKLNIA